MLGTAVPVLRKGTYVYMTYKILLTGITEYAVKIAL